MLVRIMTGVLLTALAATAGCAEDPYERLVRCKALLQEARSCADAEAWDAAVTRCEERHSEAVAGLEERLESQLAALGAGEVDLSGDPQGEGVLAAAWQTRGPEGPRALQGQLAAARTRLASCSNPDSIAGALARGRGCRVRQVATWDEDRKFDYEVCSEFVLDARHGVVAQASSGYRRGQRRAREAMHEGRGRDAQHAAH